MTIRIEIYDRGKLLGEDTYDYEIPTDPRMARIVRKQIKIAILEIELMVAIEEYEREQRNDRMQGKSKNFNRNEDGDRQLHRSKILCRSTK